MVLRKLAMALLSIGVVLPGLTHALALREVKTKSALGEPFHAEIELAELGDLTEEDIKVNLAQQEDFARLGIEEVYILAELRFEVVVKRDARSYIKISTHRRITEPFLDFIVRVSWPNNTRLQQVTALLDPPTIKVTKAQETVLPPVVVQMQPVIKPVVPIEAQLETSSPPTTTTYRVRKNDTLWQVARRVRPSPAISVSQMMKVLHKANPQAFIANNMNWLKDGEVLRVPSLMDTQSVAELKKATPAQVPAVTQAQAANKPLAHQQINATATAKAAEPVASAPRAQMKLLAPKANQTVAASSTGLAETTQTNTAKNALANGSNSRTSAAPVQTLAKHNSRLVQELSSLETQLKLNDKKIAMQNAKLAQLEAQLKARRLAEQAKHNDKKTDLDKKAVATLACALAMQSFLTTEAKAEEAATTATTEQAAPAKTEGGSSMVPIIGGGLVLVIVALIFFLKSKGKKDQPTPPVAKPQAPAAKPAAPVAKAEAPVAAPTPVAKPAPVEPAKPQDPLEEVRPYLEMERYPQAVGLLTKALVQHPDRADIHLKLLEIFTKQKDRTAFDNQYRQLEALGELESIVAADKLKQQFPEVPKPATINKEGALEFTPSAKPAAPAAPVVEETPAFSLDDLENDFKMSLSNPNMKALDIPLAPDPIELQRPEEPVVESQKIAELDSLLDGGLEFKFDQKAPVAPAEAHQGLDFAFETPVEPEPIKTDIGTGLSLDSLDDFLAEHKIEAEPIVEAAPVASLDFEQELAKFKEEKQEVEPEQNLAEGFELEEFKLDDSVTAKEDDLGFDVADADFSIEQPLVEEKSEFKLDFDTPSADLSDMVASFDKEELADVDLPDDLNFDDVDVSVSSDDVLAELDKEFSFLATTNENSTRLDLARAYLEMGDRLGARDLLEEVVAEGDSNQKTEAQGMLMRIA